MIKKYVENLILVIPKDEVDITLTSFNNYDHNIQFTIEFEIDDRIPFLDMTLIRDVATGGITLI